MDLRAPHTGNRRFRAVLGYTARGTVRDSHSVTLLLCTDADEMTI